MGIGRLFVLYDARARRDPDEAAVLATANSAREAHRERAEGVAADYLFYESSVWFEYQVVGKTLKNGRIRLDLSPLPKEVKR
jgi:hypothetical protein